MTFGGRVPFEMTFGVSVQSSVLSTEKDPSAKSTVAHSAYLLLIPDDGCQPEDFFCDRGYTDIRIAERWSPKPGYTPTSRIMNHLHCPSKLRDNILVGKRCHMWVRPCMH